MSSFLSFIAGLIFGIGLIISGMTNPAKVQGFLDLFGRWDPSLAFVMGGAIAVGLIAFHVAKKRSSTLLGGPMQLPTRRDIDAPLVLGSLLFGAGWGLGGFCPGPAITALGAGSIPALIFVAAMLAGMLIFDRIEKHRARR